MTCKWDDEWKHMNKTYVFTNKEKSKASFLPSCFALLFFFFFFPRERIHQSVRRGIWEWFFSEDCCVISTWQADWFSSDTYVCWESHDSATCQRAVGENHDQWGWVGVNGDNAELSALLWLSKSCRFHFRIRLGLSRGAGFIVVRFEVWFHCDLSFHPR